MSSEQHLLLCFSPLFDRSPFLSLSLLHSSLSFFLSFLLIPLIPTSSYNSSALSLLPTPHSSFTMSTSSRRRLMKDFKRLQTDPPGGISGAPCQDNIMLWNAVIFGPSMDRISLLPLTHSPLTTFLTHTRRTPHTAHRTPADRRGRGRGRTDSPLVENSLRSRITEPFFFLIHGMSIHLSDSKGYAARRVSEGRQ